MVKMSAVYQGEKRCEATHGPSNSKIATDAPKDNNGRGEAFSPTDLLGVAVGTCMLTTMAIHAEKDGIKLLGSRVEVEKEMLLNPRRVGRLTVVLHLPQAVPQEHRKRLEDLAMNCPVKISLHPDMQIPVQIHYDI